MISLRRKIKRCFDFRRSRSITVALFPVDGAASIHLFLPLHTYYFFLISPIPSIPSLWYFQPSLMCLGSPVWVGGRAGDMLLLNRELLVGAISVATAEQEAGRMICSISNPGSPWIFHFWRESGRRKRVRMSFGAKRGRDLAAISGNLFVNLLRLLLLFLPLHRARWAIFIIWLAFVISTDRAGLHSNVIKMGREIRGLQPLSGSLATHVTPIDSRWNRK